MCLSRESAANKNLAQLNAIDFPKKNEKPYICLENAVESADYEALFVSILLCLLQLFVEKFNNNNPKRSEG